MIYEIDGPLYDIWKKLWFESSTFYGAEESIRKILIEFNIELIVQKNIYKLECAEEDLIKFMIAYS